MTDSARPPLGPMSIRERLVEFFARLHVDQPDCRVCGESMRYRDIGRFWAWCCPNEDREDHITGFRRALRKHITQYRERHDLEPDDD